MAEASSDVEGSLDRIVARLTKPGASKEAKALLVDARRLRTIVGNWRTITPTDEARTEMTARVEQLLRSVEAVAPPDAPEPGPRLSTPSLKVGPERRASMPIIEEIRPGAISEPLVGRGGARGSSASPASRERRVSQPVVEPEVAPRAPSATPAPKLESEPPPRLATPPAAPRAAAPEPPPSDTTWDDPPSLVVPARSLFPAVDEPTRIAPVAAQAQADQEKATARDQRLGGGRAAFGEGMGLASSAGALPMQGPPSLVMQVSPAIAEAAKQARSNGLQPVRARTLPDLDISGIAQLVDDGGDAFEDPFENRPTVTRNFRPDLEMARRRPASEPPPRPRVTPVPPRRRGETAPPDDRAARMTGRPSRIFDDHDTDAGDEAAGLYSAAGDEAVAAGRGTPRPTPRPSTPPASRGEKTAIAVRPLPPPEHLDKRLVLLTEPYSTRADAYRALRRKLSGPGAPRTIAVTSAQPEEGKTSCAVNLALAFRETSNEKILLIEANLRAPTLAKLFGFEPPVCFAKQMAKNRDLPRASWTVAEQFEPLHVLAVDPTSKTSPLLDPVAFANALEQLVEAGYDHIIVDTPPALGGSDVNLIADAVDGMVVVAWIKKSKKSLVKKAIDQLRPATILGVVTLEG